MNNDKVTNPVDSNKAFSSSSLVDDSQLKNLPALLSDCLRFFNPGYEQDIFFLGALPVIASAMPNVSGLFADECPSPNLYVAIVADAGSGKGALRHARNLGAAIDRKIVQERENYERLRAANTSSKPADKKSSGAFPDYDLTPSTNQETPPKSFFLSGNSSAAALFENLSANQGRGIIFESEIDTLVQALSKEWGNFSDMLRNAYHHEPISVDRLGRSGTINSPRLSTMVSGTPHQFRRLIPSIEDGLYSRFMLYRFDAPIQWATRRPTKQFEGRKQSIEVSSKMLNELHNMLSSRTSELQIKVTESQWDLLDIPFRQYLTTVCNVMKRKEMASSIKRGSLCAFRMTMILTVLRAFEQRKNELCNMTDLTPSDEDVRFSVDVAIKVTSHALEWAETMLPVPFDGNMNRNAMRLFERLPDVFYRTDAVTIGDQIGVRGRTVDKYLKCLADDGLLIRELGTNGLYSKHTESSKNTEGIPAAA